VFQRGLIQPLPDHVVGLERRMGGRLSLWHLHESLTRAAARPLVEWMQGILECWIIGQLRGCYAGGPKFGTPNIDRLARPR
jgi:hypothetical protein